MTQFIYHTLKELEPRPGVKFATSYYQQTVQEHDRVLAHVQRVMEACLTQLQEQGDLDVIHEPLPGFPRTGQQSNYSFWDIVSDLNDYLVRGNDVPSGMLGRWNRLFEDNQDFQIQMVTPTELAEIKQANFQKLFD